VRVSRNRAIRWKSLPRRMNRTSVRSVVGIDQVLERHVVEVELAGDAHHVPSSPSSTSPR
jgi:hypothetical protein